MDLLTYQMVLLTYELVFFTYHGFYTIATSSRIISKRFHTICLELRFHLTHDSTWFRVTVFDHPRRGRGAQI
jgi:hypothetical protein